jgi:hypothetical protein
MNQGIMIQEYNKLIIILEAVNIKNNQEIIIQQKVHDEFHKFQVQEDQENIDSKMI